MRPSSTELTPLHKNVEHHDIVQCPSGKTSISNWHP